MGPTLIVHNVRRIAVLRANALGDLIFALPALDALRAAYANAEITLLGRPWHAEFLAARPSPVDSVAVVPGGEGTDAPWPAAPPADLERFVAAMREQQFDIAIQLHGGGRNSNALVRQLGARMTAGCATPDAPPLDLTIPYVYYQQETARCLEVVGLVGARAVTIEARISVTAADEAEAATLVPLGDPYAVLHPGASDPRRRWPVERFVQVGTTLAERGLRVVVTGSDAERELATRLADGIGPAAVNVAGRSSLAALTGILSGAVVVVANDTGPLHLAFAVGAPTVGIYWVGNLINGGPMTRARHRPALSWRTRCPDCGTDCVRDTCEHESSFVTDVATDEVIRAVDELAISAANRPELLAGVPGARRAAQAGAARDWRHVRDR